MPYAASYSEITVATIPRLAWEQCWDTLLTWKSFLQSFPGGPLVRISAREIANGDVHLWVQTVWEHEEELDEWVKSNETASHMVERLDPPGYDISSDVYVNL